MKEPTNVTELKPPEINQVYGADNFISLANNPVPKPDLSDPYGLYNQFMNSQDIVNARNQVAQTRQRIDQTQQALDTTTRALENQNEQAYGGTGASINLIGKQVGRARELTADELNALGRSLQAQQAYLGSLTSNAQNLYNVALRERESLNDLIRATGGQAGITYADSYETALQKANAYEKEKERVSQLQELIRATSGQAGITEGDSYEDALRKASEYEKAKEQEAYARDWDRKKREMKEQLKQQEKQLKKADKKALKQELIKAGLNPKSMSNKQMRAKLASFYARQVKQAEEEWKLSMEVKRHSLKEKGRGGRGYSDEFTVDKSNNGIMEYINQGFNSGANWQDIAETLSYHGIDTREGSLADKYLQYKFMGWNKNLFE